jgi:hypothetical protein
MKCPKCDQPMDLEEKDTSSGRDMIMVLRSGRCSMMRERRTTQKNSSGAASSIETLRL